MLINDYALNVAITEGVQTPTFSKKVPLDFVIEIIPPGGNVLFKVVEHIFFFKIIIQFLKLFHE